jgi:hypothetical protein
MGSIISSSLESFSTAPVQTLIWTVLSTLLLGALVFVLGALVFVIKSAINYIRDPLGLRKIPSPNLWAAVFPFWLMNETWKGRRFEAIETQHRRLGKVVRLSPTWLVFNSPQAVVDIYGHQASNKIKKGLFYDSLAGQYHDVFLSTDREEHSRKMRNLANSFALKNVVRMEPVIRERIRSLMVEIDKNIKISESSSESSTLDMRYW